MFTYRNTEMIALVTKHGDWSLFRRPIAPNVAFNKTKLLLVLFCRPVCIVL